MNTTGTTTRILTCLLIGAATTSTAADYFDLLDAADPIALWRLGETSGNDALDETGLHPGTYHGPTLGVDGFTAGGTAAQFSHRDYIEIPHSDDFLLDSGSISLWFMDTSSTNKAGLLSKDSQRYDTGGHLTMYTHQGRVKVRLQSTDESYTVESTPITLDQWHNVVFTFGDDGMDLFFDGVWVDEHDYAGGLGSSSGGVGNFEPWVLGAASWQSRDQSVTPLQHYFSGVIDEVAVFDYQLDGGQVASLHVAALSIPEPSSVMLVLAGVMLMSRSWRRRG